MNKQTNLSNDIFSKSPEKLNTSNIHAITIDVTETMTSLISDMPELVAKTFLTSILEMACIMVQTGDINFDFVDRDNLQFKVTAFTRSGEFNLEVDLLSY